MAAPEEENANWLFDLGLIGDISVPNADLPSLEQGFQWPTTSCFTPSTNPSAQVNDSCEYSDNSKECGSKKRWRTGACIEPDSKAHREKMRRDKLNDRFQELCSILEPGRTPKTDKATILSDAVRMVNKLRDEAKKLRESNENLQEKINELKAEKNELRDEKQKLKAAKDKLDQQLKAFNTKPGFLPHPSAIPAPFPPSHQVVGSKLVPFVGYPGIPMWQFVPPAAVDTTEDHVLRPPVA